MSEQPKDTSLHTSDEVPSDATDDATALPAEAEVASAKAVSTDASPQTPVQPALKLATPATPRPTEVPTPAPAAAQPSNPTTEPKTPRARTVSITSPATTEESSINVPMLIIDAIAAAIAIAFTVLLLQDLSPFLN